MCFLAHWIAFSWGHRCTFTVYCAFVCVCENFTALTFFFTVAINVYVCVCAKVLSLLTILCKHREQAARAEKKIAEPSASLLSAEWKLKRSRKNIFFLSDARLMAKMSKRGCGKKQPNRFYILWVFMEEPLLQHEQKNNKKGKKEKDFYFQFFLTICFLFFCFFKWVSVDDILKFFVEWTLLLIFNEKRILFR